MKKSGTALVVSAALFAMLLMAAGTDATDYPESGLLSIFHPGYEFFSHTDMDPVSVPPPREDCGVMLLTEGEDSFEWRIRTLKRARESIRIQTYIFTADELGKRVADRLKRKRRHGVKVQLIVDAYTKFKTADRRMYADLELKGVSVMGYEPVYLLGTINDRILQVDEVNMRFHEKYWVIDDEVSFLGGTNIANEYGRWGTDPNDMWRDQDVLLTGEVVDDVARAFDQNYEYFLKRRLDRLLVNRPAFWAKLWWEVSDTKPPPVGPDGQPLPKLTQGTETEPATVRFVRSRPRHQEDYVYQAYLHLLREAKETILIENAYFVPNRPILDALIEARQRGVEVIVITNSETTNDVSGMQPLTRYSYQPLMEEGVVIYEWQGDHRGFGSLHSKFMVVDGKVSVIGSFNLDPRSIYLNSENVVLIHSEKVAKDLTAYVDRHDIENSERITMEEAREWREPSDIRDQFKLMFGIALEDWY